MKKKILTIIFLLGCEITFAQLYAPNIPITSTINSSTGNVGIGTTSPNQKLAVNGNQSVSGDVEVGVDGVGASTISGPASSGAIQIKTNAAVGGYTNRYLRLGWKDNNAIFSPALSINDDFNVGIGTTSPNERLTIIGNQSISGNFKLGSDGSISTISGPASSGAIEIKTNSAIGGYSNRYLRLGWKDNNAIFSPAISINEDFNVGVGTTVPLSKFHIADGAGGEQLRLSRGTGSVRFAQEMNKDDLYLYNNDATMAYMFWREDGNIGIGTTSPDAKLAVKGDIHTKEVRVDVTGAMAPDYVFEKDYNLISLPELENYLTQNKHLPEVPSAKEFEADGMKLKEMNLMLLKKVEELTLYVIEQNQIATKQQIELNKLKSELELLKNK